MIQKQDIISIYFVKNAKNINKYLEGALGAPFIMQVNDELGQCILQTESIKCST